MVDRYSPKRARVARMLSRWNTGTVTLTRSTPGTPDPTEPWVPGVPTLTVYALDARVNGVSQEYPGQVTVAGADQVVIASPKARVDGAVVDLAPRMTDELKIDGARKVIKKIEPVPSAGPAARFHIYIGS